MRHLRFGASLLLLVFVSMSPARAQDTYQTPPSDLAALIDAPVAPDVSISPDQGALLILHRPGPSPIAELAASERRLAGLRVNPQNSGPSRDPGFTGLSLLALDGTETTVTGAPEQGIRNVRWAPGGERFAFTVDREDRIDLYVGERQSGQARRLIDAAINDVGPGAPYEWIDGDALIVLTVPAGRGAAPVPDPVPAGPVIQENDGEPAPARTYQDLLQDGDDESLFAYLMTSQIIRVGMDGSATEVGRPALYTDVSPSPDGDYLLVESIHEPFSYLVPYNRFPETVEVWSSEGQRVAGIAELPLADDVPTAFGSVRTGVRNAAWRPDVPASLYWVEALDDGDAHVVANFRDRLVTLDAPFGGAPDEVVRLPLRYSGARWAEGGRALVSEVWFSTRQRRTYAVDVDGSGEPRVIVDISSEDRYADPGAPVNKTSERGTRVLHSSDGGRTVFMVGQGASEEGNRPFLRRLNTETGEVDELFRSEAPYYEMPLDVLNEEGTLLLTQRESPDEPPNVFVRDLEAGTVEAVTAFPHPYPAMAGITKEPLRYERADGIELSATLYLPAGYDSNRDGPLPALVWAYPREFKSADAASQRSDSPYQFKRVSYWGAIPYVTQGYAVIDNAAMPVVGQGDAEPNDSFREQLIENAQAAIDEGVRRGVVDADRVGIGGHSYGAFMTANLLAHSDLFRAGVARSGAYNRTLTPFGFQREERLFWEAPEIYFYMSPFMHAEKVNEPILLIHGMADNNSGTFPIQSQRFYAALKGLGATARLVMLPQESHGYRARESLLHMLWETNRWLELHVKNAQPRPQSVTDEPPVS